MRAWLVVLLVGGACTHHRPVTQVSALAGKDVTVETTNGARVSVTAEQTPAGLSFRTGTGYVAPQVVARVVERRRGRGALEGFGIGLGLGFVTGAIAGYAKGDDDDCGGQEHCVVWTAKTKAFTFGMTLGILGGGFGFVIGLLRGSHFVYSYGDQVRVTPIGPPGSVGGVTINF